MTRRCCLHAFDCAVHNMPAYPAGPCDCWVKTAHQLASSELARLDKENFGRLPRDEWTDNVLSVRDTLDAAINAKESGK